VILKDSWRRRGDGWGLFDMGGCFNTHIVSVYFFRLCLGEVFKGADGNGT
jgi:hypothetical protein